MHNNVGTSGVDLKSPKPLEGSSYYELESSSACLCHDKDELRLVSHTFIFISVYHSQICDPMKSYPEKFQ